MTIKTLGTDTEIIITKINQITKTTLGQNTDIDHHTHQTLPTIIDRHPTVAGHGHDKVNIETTLIANSDSNRQNSRDRQSNAPQYQIIDIVIEVETRIVIGHLLDKTMLLIQEIAVTFETLESTLSAKPPEAITTMTTKTTSI